jgi:CubicO group peptidase (beta-lactamase class C family)
MKHLYTSLLALALLTCSTANSQSLYFPPLTSTAWDTLPSSSIGLCPPQVDSLYSFLQANHTKGFIVLKDGKIVLEKYFGTFTRDSVWYWASAGKSLTATLVGTAQQQGLLHIDSSVTKYLGHGWSSATTAQEDSITVKHLLNMTAGLDDNPPAPCENEDTAAGCLLYLTDAGTRWSYHTGAYRKLQQVVANAAGVTYNAYTNNVIENHTGMNGAWFNGVYYSNLRSMARFGLTILNKGTWATDTILSDGDYYDDMIHSSQPYNLSYGYLWWLNGQPSAMAPGSQIVFQQSLFADAPADMFCALGKNDQKVYVVPSRNMVVVRMGDAANSSVLAWSEFDNALWQMLDSTGCTVSGLGSIENDVALTVYPNPSTNFITVNFADGDYNLKITDMQGKTVYTRSRCSGIVTVDVSALPAGIYTLTCENGKQRSLQKVVVQRNTK